MRWLHYDESNPAEAETHAGMLQQIAEWWQEFSQNANRLDALFSGREEWDLPEWMSQHLQSIHPDLMWEYGPAIHTQGHRLVITPEAISHLRPLAEDIVARAPQIEGWEFYTYRIPESVEMSQQTVQARAGLDISDVQVSITVGQHNRIDLAFRWQTLPADEEQAFNAAFVTAETLLGEEQLDRWVGLIEVVDGSQPADNSQRFVPLGRLKPTFDALVDSIREQLPAEPYMTFAEDAQWAALQLEPEEADDYAERYDLLTCITCNPDLIAATFTNAPFFSERYSRCNERFCYLKVDGSALSDADFPDRQQMEELIQAALEPEQLGGLVGGGTGLRYSYVELALTNVAGGIAAIRSAMQKLGAPKRSWIQFHDADLSTEWVGIYDDSPVPPMDEQTDA
jgi:hypothetical protein